MTIKKRHLWAIPFVVIAIVALLSGAVLLIWNNIVTDVLNVKRLTYGQAVGLFVLCKILFGSFRPGRPGGFRRRPALKEKLMHLTPEERERFRSEWQQRMRGKPNGPEQ